AQVKHRLLVTASHPAVPLPDPALGWGTVNPLAAVTTVLPEEGATEPAAVTPPDARRPDAAVPDKLGPALAVAAVAGAGCLVLIMMLRAHLYAAGRKRRWSRARVVKISRPAAPGEQSPPHAGAWARWRRRCRRRGARRRPFPG